MTRNPYFILEVLHLRCETRAKTKRYHEIIHDWSACVSFDPSVTVERRFRNALTVTPLLENKRTFARYALKVALVRVRCGLLSVWRLDTEGSEQVAFFYAWRLIRDMHVRRRFPKTLVKPNEDCHDAIAMCALRRPLQQRIHT